MRNSAGKARSGYWGAAGLAIALIAAGCGDDGGGGAFNFGGDGGGGSDTGALDLGDVDLGDIDLGDIDLGDIDLGDIDLGDIDLGDIDLGDVDLGDVLDTLGADGTASMEFDGDDYTFDSVFCSDIGGFAANGTSGALSFIYSEFADGEVDLSLVLEDGSLWQERSDEFETSRDGATVTGGGTVAHTGSGDTSEVSFTIDC